MSYRKNIICLNVKISELTQFLKYFGLWLVKFLIVEICFCLSITICELIIVMQRWIEWILLSDILLLKLSRCLLMTKNELKSTLRWYIIWFLMLLLAPPSIFQIWTYGHLEPSACIIFILLLCIIIKVSSLLFVCYFWVLKVAGW